MIMHIVRIAFEKLVQEHVERETVTIFEKQVVAFQIGLVALTIGHNTPTTPTVKKIKKSLHLCAPPGDIENWDRSVATIPGDQVPKAGSLYRRDYGYSSRAAQQSKKILFSA
jgi:hypothetical protein